MSKQEKLPSLSRIKKALYSDWSLRVKQRDGFKCVLCGATKNLTAHHWYCSDHHAHAARYSVKNGATLCYACHIRGIHPRADYVSVIDIAVAINADMTSFGDVDALIKTELTTSLLRNMWDNMRSRVITLEPYLVKSKTNKLFVFVAGDQAAVVGNVVSLTHRTFETDSSLEVATISNVQNGYRYTLKQISEVNE